MTTIRRKDTPEALEFWKSLEDNRKYIQANWPLWKRRGSVGEGVVRPVKEGP